MRRTHRPIFLFGFQRGGTTLLLDLFLSHPSVCRSGGELHMVFRGRDLQSRRARALRRLTVDLPLRALTGMSFFAHNAVGPRPALNAVAARFVDRALYRSRFAVTHPCAPGRRYTPAELAACRMASKGINGTTFAAEPLLGVYPDATMFLLVRHGLAICEGRVRRGEDPRAFGREYAAVATEMLRLHATHEACHLLRFEDLVGRPVEMLGWLYGRAGLDVEELEHLYVRPRPDRSGGNGWHDPGELPGLLDVGRDAKQVASLGAEARDRFLDAAGAALEELGYAAGGSEGWP